MTEWQDDDTFETTYGTLRKAMAEAQEAERERIVALLRGDGRFVGARRLLIELIEGDN